MLAGRDAASLAKLARQLGVEARAFALDDSAAVDRGIAGCTAVLHCAGPFSRTWRAVAEACVRAGAHYVDITGEVAVFEGLAALGARAQTRGVMLLPGAGFDVVPTDCLAAHLQRRFSGAVSLTLAVQGFGGISRGTARTILEGASSGVVPRGAPRRTLELDLGRGPFSAVAVPTADVFAARHTTGIADVSFYFPMSRLLRLATRALPWLSPLSPALRVPALRDALVRAMTGGAAGPDAAARARAGVTVQGEARDARGRSAVSRLHLPNGYTFTARAAVAIAERVLAGDAPPGFQTAATAYGPDLVTAIEGVRREDLPAAAVGE